MDAETLLRIVHRGSTLVRALRRDPHLEHDHGRETSRASQLHQTLDATARKVVGCVAPADCDCPICLEAR